MQRSVVRRAREFSPLRSAEAFAKRLEGIFGEQLVSVELHPITLGFGQPATVRGRPMLADRELGRKIINDLIERSRPHGTTVEWVENRGIGIVRLPRAQDQGR